MKGRSQIQIVWHHFEKALTARHLLHNDAKPSGFDTCCTMVLTPCPYDPITCCTMILTPCPYDPITCCTMMSSQKLHHAPLITGYAIIQAHAAALASATPARLVPAGRCPPERRSRSSSKSCKGTAGIHQIKNTLLHTHCMVCTTSTTGMQDRCACLDASSP